jgi:hypothetical protein
MTSDAGAQPKRTDYLLYLIGIVLSVSRISEQMGLARDQQAAEGPSQVPSALRGLMYQGCLPLGVACHS